MASTAVQDKVFLPLHPPPTTYKNEPHAVLSNSEQTMYDEVLAHFTKSDPEYSLPNIEKGELMDEEKFWLSRECILRYLRASKWKVPTAIQRLEATLKWRREFGLYDVVSASHVEPEAVTGKEILFGYDVTGKPAFYMIPSRQNTNEATRQIQFAVWMLERGVDLMEPGVENLALLINFGDRGKNPSISTALSVLHILQNHYPERLGLALIINVPFLVNAFFKVVMPLVDPITRQKVKFNPEIIKDGLFTSDMVMKEWNGDHHFEYNHEKYWPDLVSMCEERVTAWMKNWRELGAEVGASEWAYKKGGASRHENDTVSDEDKKGENVTVTEVHVATSETTEKVAISEVPKMPDTASEKIVEAPTTVETKTDTSALAGHAEATSSHAGPSVAAVVGASTVAVGGDAAGGDAASGGDGGDGGE
ncbi:CRAL-TRIO domain-containing protein [Flammula alnicola]|nr:CRAL-TRIO domain-containing protein [Flammula alnicola]